MKSMYYNVIVAGGSVAGLLCARQIASNGFSVLVIEEDYEIGTPEHCGGLVSAAGLDELGLQSNDVSHFIKLAEIIFPNGKKFEINSQKQRVIELDRRVLDKQIAFQAQQNGAIIKVKTSFQEITPTGIRTNSENLDCKIFVDARGAASLVHKDRTGIIASAQYEIYADWITHDRIKVFVDSEKYPGFFSWIIPTGINKAKIGVAGRHINPANALDEFLKDKTYCVIRKIYAPLWIKGPIKNFVDGKTVIVGDAAGQAKPTTAGGIFTSGMGGIYAGNAISKFLASNNWSDLDEYQKNWTGRFGKEFQKQLLVRKILERMENKTINKLFKAINPQILQEISEHDDFDFHTISLLKMLGVRDSIKVLKTLVYGEFGKLK